MYKLVIFDFDGTLVDSAPGILAVMEEVCSEYGFPPATLELWKHLIGVPLNRQVEILFPEHHGDFHQEVADRYREMYDYRAIEICPPFPGAESLLTSLRGSNLLVTIASSKRRHLVETVLDHHNLSRFFDLIVGASEVTKHKPDPESVHHTLERLRLKLDETIVIGDSSFDLDMARNAGCDAIGVTTGVHTFDVLSRSGPKHIVGNLTELLPLLLDNHAV